jgi:hypothetical protein
LETLAENIDWDREPQNGSSSLDCINLTLLLEPERKLRVQIDVIKYKKIELGKEQTNNDSIKL